MKEETQGTEMAVVLTAQGLLENSNAIAINNVAECKQACEFLKRIKIAGNKVEEVLSPIKKSAYETYKQAIKLYSLANDDLELANKAVRTKVTGYLMSIKNIPEDIGDGVSVKTTYEVTSINIKEVCQGIIDGKVPESILMPNTPEINKLATAMKDFFNVAGIEVKPKRAVSIRL